MAERVLTEEQCKNLAKSIEMNGGKVADPEFKELEDYLRNNPPETTVYLDN